MNRTSRARLWLGVMLAVSAIASVFVPAVSARAGGEARVSVMTRNLYLGSGLDNLVQAQTVPQFIEAVTQDWNNIVANDFPRRARAVATEVQVTRPDIIGLQEAMLFREQLVSDGLLNAETVVYDFVAILRAELAARGLRYSVVATSQNVDAEAPRINPASPHPLHLSDVRITDRDVILVRSHLVGQFSNPMDRDYAAQLVLPSPGGPLTFTRGWTSIDYAVAPGRTVRIFNTHLEVRASGPIQVAQGNEFIALVNASPHPVIALGDFNSAADRSTTPTYGNLIAGGLQDVWTTVQPHNPGRTCCQPELLDDIVPPTERIDLVLTKGSWDPGIVVRTGPIPFRLSPPPLWASDHAGVFATLELE